VDDDFWKIEKAKGFSSGTGSNVIGWHIIWTDASGNVLSTDTVTGANGTDAFPSSTTAVLFATVTAYDVAGGAFIEPTIESDVTPLAPTDVVATMYSSTEIDLSWTNNSAIASGYDIQQSINGGAFVDIGTVAANVDSFSDNSLDASDSVVYNVVAVNTSGTANPTVSSSPATSSSVTTPTGVPTFSVTASPTDPDSAVLTWGYQGNDDESFELEMEDQTIGQNFYLFSQSGAVGSTSTGTTTISGLTTGDMYAFRIRADHTDTTVSNYVSASFAPSGGSIEVSASATKNTTVNEDDPGYYLLDVTWNAADQFDATGAPLTGYDVQWRGSSLVGNGWASLGALPDQQALSYLGATELQCDVDRGETGQFRVCAEYSDGTSSGWGYSCLATEGGGYGSAPTIIASVVSSTEVDLTISDDPNSADGTVAFGLRYGPITGSGGQIFNLGNQDELPVGSSENVAIPGLTSGVEYDFQVVAEWHIPAPGYDNDSRDEFGGSISHDYATPGNEGDTAPAAPDKIWTANLGYRGPYPIKELIWHNSPDNEDGYLIQESDTSDFSEAAQTSVGSDVTTYTQPLLTNKPLYCRIAAYRGSAQSAWVNITITPPIHQVIVLLKGDNITGITAGPVNAIHESVGLGHYNDQGQIVVDCAWSFGGDGKYRYFGPETQWLGFPFPSSLEGMFGPHGLYSPEGIIYQTDGFGQVIASKTVTKQQANSWLKYMNGRANPGLKDIYDPGFDFVGGPSLDCVTYSNLEYARAPGGN
jgi:hypothetical protein